MSEILLPNGHGWEKVPTASIQYVESQARYCRVVTVQGEYRYYCALRAMMRKLPEQHFMRVHKSYIISLSFVHFIGKTEVVVAGRSLPLARRMRADLYSRFNKF